jgi:phosphoglycerate dehydrogenase-like enzyme
MDEFRLALSADFRNADGSPAFADLDLSSLTSDPRVSIDYVRFGAEVESHQLEGFDALIMLYPPRFTRASAPRDGRLALISRFGVGYDSIDVDACTDAGIALTITPGGIRRPVAVAIMTLLLALSGRMMEKDRLTRGGPAAYLRRGEYTGVGLIGKTLASVGMGNIAAEMVRLAKPFDLRVIAHDPNVGAAQAAELGVTLVDLDTVFREGDFVTVNCPLSAATRHLVDARLLSLMKPTAYFINTARGPIVDQKALTEVLSARRIAGAGLDVLEAEPPDPADPILALDNVILTPHALCLTDQCFQGIGVEAVRNVVSVLNGERPGGLVNPAVLDKPGWRRRLAH